LTEICRLRAVEMARLIRARELSARETVTAHLAQIERVNPSVNAIVTLAAEQALEAADRADEAQAHGLPLGPLHGLPIAHKDLQPTKGIRTTFGSRIFRDFVPDADSPLVTRIKDAGAITIGKTNTPEFGAGSQTFNEVFGATLNPWDLTKTCGGSSGGAAVALACHMLPIADGTDIGASIRNPASFCAVVGFRPSQVFVPPAADAPFNVEGPLARSVDDAALLYSAIARASQPLERDFKEVRIAWWKNLGGIPVDRRVRERVNAQRSAFESLGCLVEEAEPDFDGVDETFRTLRFHSAALRLGEHARRHPDLVKETIRWEVEQGARLTEHEVEKAKARHKELRRRMQTFMERYEFFVLPVSQVPPFDVTQQFPTEIDGVKMESYIDWMKSCYYISVMGNPAISVPCGLTSEGLPVGVQIVGRHGADWSVLQLARALDPDRKP
jgi:amidase